MTGLVTRGWVGILICCAVSHGAAGCRHKDKGDPGGTSTNAGGEGGTLGCPVGSEGCPCADSVNPCDSADLLACEQGRCTLVCTPGTENCICAEGDDCDSAEDGADLACTRDRCVREDCDRGDDGCTCLADFTCTTNGSDCVDGQCIAEAVEPPPGCDPGTLDCGCDDGDCTGDLVCGADDVCREPEEPPPPEQVDTCDANDDCAWGYACVDEVCEVCDLGVSGCSCLSTGGCLGGLACVLGRCVNSPSEVLPVPDERRCHTPCRGDLVRNDGSVAICDSEGLLDGCIGGLACEDGSCIPEGTSPPSCAEDVDCPDFQACIGGTCYSSCELDADCPDTLICRRRTCRLPCDTTTSPCPDGYHCLVADGEFGHCEPLESPDASARPVASGSFSLSREQLEFSNTSVSATVELTNTGSIATMFQVSKLRHTEYEGGEPYTDTETPLYWISIGESGDEEQLPSFEVLVDAGETVELGITGAGNDTLPRWDGVLSVTAPGAGEHLVDLSYVERPDGQWSGKVFYFANFPDAGLDDWLAAGKPDNQSVLGGVPNALVQRWAAFKFGRIDVDEFQAMLTATVTGSWEFQSVRDRCTQPRGACYLIEDGIRAYTASLADYPVPSGVSELPVAFNLKVDPRDPTHLTGRIESTESLQYAGSPPVEFVLTDSPLECPDASDPTCRIDLASLSADVVVGGRYTTDGACDADFAKSQVPWLVPGFHEHTVLDVGTGQRYRAECRDQRFPFGDEDAATNVSLAASNPIPDGQTRRRSLELVDGFLVGQREFYLLVREHFPSFLGGGDTEGFSAYGYLRLTRSPADLDDNAFAGSLAPTGADTASKLSLDCSRDLLDQVLGEDEDLRVANAGTVYETLLQGLPPGATPMLVEAPEYVHYYCPDTGLFDAGPDSSAPVACPAETNVEFFTLLNQDDAALAANGCQRRGQDGRGTCGELLAAWRAAEAGANPAGFRSGPVWRCADDDAVYCDSNRLDLRADKIFYAAATGGEASALFLPLLTEIDLAFRYRTRFRGRSGGSIGFAPEICVPNSDEIPYCYDPSRIEAIRERVDCLIHLHTDEELRTGLDDAQRIELADYLTRDFSYAQELDPIQDVPVTYDGFERLYSELLIMLGDEAYTSAFAARFDLAGMNVRSFEGSLFEPAGINLSGAAGFEMYNLYEAAQYYDLALERFYHLSPRLWTSIGELGESEGFIGQATVASYFDRLIRASTQKSRSWSEVSRKYLDFNRPDLARLVVERAYTSSYLESVVLSRLMLRVIEVASAADLAQIVRTVETASLSYRAALLDMRDVYAAISDDRTVFGFPPDYIPFPALDQGDGNAFEKVFAAARSKTAVAAEKEQSALSNDRSFNVDAAAFQSELASIRNNYENQLADLCGTFTGDDGRIYPAIPKYAAYNERAELLGNPCGLAGNGGLHQAMGRVEAAALGMRAIREAQEGAFTRIESEARRCRELCALQQEDALYEIQFRTGVMNENQMIRTARQMQRTVDFMFSAAQTTVQMMKCSIIAGTAAGGDCPTAGAAAAAWAGISIAVQGVDVVVAGLVDGAEGRLEELQAENSVRQIERQCDYSQVESEARIRDLLIEAQGYEVEVLQSALSAKLALAEVDALRNQAGRLLAQQAEAEQLAINVEAARNDPNVRIYKNDAILNADRTFDAAVKEAYRATKVFEYYTSQSYARRDNLFLVRMVAAGDYTLEAYLDEIESAFGDFEESYGNPDLRVEILSLRDDVMQIPYLAEDGTALSHADRIARFRERLADPRLLDEDGYLTLPFATSFEHLSPLTRNHKVAYVEAEIIGSDVGDAVGRVYLRQKGTGTVHPVTGDPVFYAFPERTAVLDPFFNGVRQLAPELYRNDRLRDRPLVNSLWEVVLNQRDERANEDIVLDSLTDVRLYVYYTDFTRTGD
ncbi:MAG: hypothetical protein JW751_23210 [Polyangiaceae bacterium]|nr:hypothetical protein [Polyangiaceae bacterium]